MAEDCPPQEEELARWRGIGTPWSAAWTGLPCAIAT